ncbi:hypothetical protein K3N28_07130 [Glycomyces sp. TRM65418]|uniref:hypothetical protein n=1 Tax=Glycomyces sp. TRM65418 TaxID=2867006 RepID=UPI001CE5EB89|nr:hypothetical protein [Glycomyces sp. TRM65418]MCC3762843.1 hypothetical protein [Glycomyces sp. TRM65418]QZD56870.1 hypothetical protein K3N28_07080 [Glycomyces sp. TRM65418]
MTETHEAPAQETDAPLDATPQPGRIALAVLGVAAVLSLGGVVYSLYRLTGMADGLDDTGVVLLANSLFSPIIVAAFAGAVAGVLAARVLRGPQKALAALGFTVIGLAAAAIAYASFSVDAAIALVLALVLLGSAIVGGLFSLPRRSVIVVAGLNAALLLLVFMFARGLFEAASSVSLFSDPLDQYGALGTALPFVAGLACGLCAFLYLRSKQSGVKLLGHLLAGAIPGAIWLVATIIAQIGVGALLGVGLDELAPLDSAFLALSFQWQYNGSMTAMFAGAFCAVLAYGLLMPKAAKRS